MLDKLVIDTLLESVEADQPLSEVIIARDRELKEYIKTRAKEKNLTLENFIKSIVEVDIDNKTNSGRL